MHIFIEIITVYTDLELHSSMLKILSCYLTFDDMKLKMPSSLLSTGARACAAVARLQPIRGRDQFDAGDLRHGWYVSFKVCNH